MMSCIYNFQEEAAWVLIVYFPKMVLKYLLKILNCLINGIKQESNTVSIFDYNIIALL